MQIRIPILPPQAPQRDRWLVLYAPPPEPPREHRERREQEERGCEIIDSIFSDEVDDMWG